jgi:structural maintenance of chromosome 3 (chondroitin sulfate proteoglycan 6)
MEKLMNKRSIILQKKEEYERKIREIGSLPTTEVESYSKVKLTELVKLLHSTNQELKNYGHVNKKALDQYVQFTEQREKLNSRKKELDDGSKVLLHFRDMC